MKTVVDIDYFSDLDLIVSPHAFFDDLRHKGPVTPPPTGNVLFVKEDMRLLGRRLGAETLISRKSR